MRIDLKRAFTVSFAPDNQRVAYTDSGSVSLASLHSGVREARCVVRNPSQLAFSADSKLLAVKTTSGRIDLLSIKEGEIMQRTLRRGRGEGCAPLLLSGNAALVDGSWGGSMEVVSLDAGEVVWASTWANEMIVQLHAGPNGTVMAHHSPKATTRSGSPPPDYFTLWTYPFGDNPVRTLAPGLPVVRSSALSADGKLLAICHSALPEQLTVIETEGGRTAATAHLVSSHHGELGWSPDGRVLGSVEEGHVRFYTPGLQRIGEVAVPYPSGVAFSPDGKWVGIASWQAGFVATLGELIHQLV